MIYAPIRNLTPRTGTKFLREDGTWVTVSGSGVSDADYGDITVSGGGTTWTIDPGAVTYAQMQDSAAGNVVLCRSDAAAGDYGEVSLALSQLFGRGAAGNLAAITLGTNLSMSGTTLNASGGGGGSATTVEVDLGTPKCCGRFTITDAGIGATNKVLCWQAPGPYTGKGTRADEAEMQPVLVTAVAPAAGSAVVYWRTPEIIVQAPLYLSSPRINTVGATFDRLDNQRYPEPTMPVRIGKVRGNVKFSYTILS